MNNADMPAMPGNLDPQDAAFLAEFDQRVGVAGLARWNSGMTKRERFAMAAMQGLLAMGPRCQGAPEDMAAHAAVCADALLAELEKEQSQ